MVPHVHKRFPQRHMSLKYEYNHPSNYFSIRIGFMLAKQKDPVMVQGRIIKEECLTFPPKSFSQILS